MNDEDALDAGDLGAWVAAMPGVLAGEQAADVACDGCVACCSSSQFVHIGPEETDTLAHVPAELLFEAPSLPEGHRVLGYDEQGRCPMLGDSGCTIYEHRPRTCRTYDCRIFAATGVDPTADGYLTIAERSRRWRFRVDDDAAPTATALRAEAHRLDADEVTRAWTRTRLAVTAVELVVGRPPAGP